MTTCNRCLYTHDIPKIEFDSSGVCNYCHWQDDMERQYPISDTKWMEIVNEMKKEGVNNQYDCVIGVSGGCDSSYLLWKLHDVGLRLLAVHWDNGWNTKTAENNMYSMLNALNIDLLRIGVDHEEYNNLCKSFLLASTPDADIPNDIALTTVLYRAADLVNTKYIINGHSFRTEGTTPLGWTYMDGKYIESVNTAFGNPPLKTFPNLLIDEWLGWLNKGIKRIRPIYYMDYNKDTVKKELHKRFGWEWYGSHHGENMYTKFVGNYLWPNKFDIDFRVVGYSAQIRSGHMTREYGLKLLGEKIHDLTNETDEIQAKLVLSDSELKQILKAPIKSHHDYETYHQYFIAHKEMFKKMVDDGLIPQTFYTKYTGDTL